MEGVESVAVHTDLELGEVRSFECVFVGEVKSPTGTDTDCPWLGACYGGEAQNRDNNQQCLFHYVLH